MTTIRNAKLTDLDRIQQIEIGCFPKEEAASRKALKERIEHFSEGFIVLEVDGHIVGFINGIAISTEKIEDVMFEKTGMYHNMDNKNLAIFGVDVDTQYQGMGYSKLLMNAYINRAKENGRYKIILTCKEHLLDYYKSFGYILEGESKSSHGGAMWYDMSLVVA